MRFQPEMTHIFLDMTNSICITDELHAFSFHLHIPGLLQEPCYKNELRKNIMRTTKLISYQSITSTPLIDIIHLKMILQRPA